ncbi:MAG: VOC family protein [Burkholderiales bacterium]|nr:VOC family protein [Burkholderiales bacterium]
MRIEPYLFFDGNAEEAIAFYRKALGAELLMLMRYKESPEPPPPGMVPPGYDNKVMHASMKIGESVVMASDACMGKPHFQGFSLSISLRKEADADRVFAALADGGKVEMPLGKTFWAPKFGMVADKFGVGWMVSLEQ